jgi:flagellar basal-body rod protein FlgB
VVDSISATLLLKALDGLSLRSIVTAQNIANAGTPGYQPIKVTFEEALRRSASGERADIRAVEPKIGLSVDETGQSELRLDLEMATAASTAGRYGALAELLNRRLQIEAVAISGSR